MKKLIITTLLALTVVNASLFVDQKLRGYRMMQSVATNTTSSATLNSTSSSNSTSSTNSTNSTSTVNTTSNVTIQPPQGQPPKPQQQPPQPQNQQGPFLPPPFSNSSKQNQTGNGTLPPPFLPSPPGNSSALPPPFIAIRGSNCTVSSNCSNHGCLDENNICRCQPGYSGLQCEKLETEVFDQLNQGRTIAQAIASRGPPSNQQAAREIALDIQNLTQRQNLPLPASDLKNLTAQIRAAANISGGNLDNLKAIAGLGPKFIETGRLDDSNYQPGSNASANLSLEQLQQNDKQKRDLLRSSSLDQIKLIDQELKKYAASQRPGLQNGAEMLIPNMSGIKGTIARLNFGSCGISQASQNASNQTTGQSSPVGQAIEIQGQNQNISVCGPMPQNRSDIPDPPQGRIKSATYKFSIQNPAATNLPAADASNASVIAATASQQAFVNLPQSIGGHVVADAQFSFTASANSFVPNLNKRKFFGASPVYSLGFSDSNGTEVKIANLTEPVRLCVPTPSEIAANSTLTPTCAYINLTNSDDIDTSVEDDSNPPSGMTCCYLNHFSSFTIVGQTKSAALLVLSLLGSLIITLFLS